MKRLTILLATVFFCTMATAQTDTTAAAQKEKASEAKPGDTIRIGNIIILKRGGKKSTGKDSSSVTIENAPPKKRSRITTNWGIVDVGFANYSDKTNYSTATADGYLVNRPGSPALGKDDFKLRYGKSINVNIWFFMQQLTLVPHVGLKYGLGLELNNYRYKSAISYKENGPIPYTQLTSNKPFIFRDSVSFSKNKLAADYLTVPFMVNFSTNEIAKGKKFNLGFGVSAGYLYSQRNKQRNEARGKERNKGDYDLEKFKFSYIAELGLGPVKFYGSYSPNSIYEHSLDMRPYNIGLRFGN